MNELPVDGAGPSSGETAVVEPVDAQVAPWAGRESSSSIDAVSPDGTDEHSDLASPTPPAPPIIDVVPLSSQGPPKRTLWSTRISLLLVAALVAGAALYHTAGGDWLWLVPLLLVPDVSIAAYLMTWLFKGWIAGNLKTHLGRDAFKELTRPMFIQVARPSLRDKHPVNFL